MDLFLTAVITVIVILVSCWQYTNYVQRTKLSWIPKEQGLPFIGIILELKKNTEIINVFGKYTRKHNGLCCAKTLTSVILATDNKFVEFILTSNQLLDKGRIYGFLLSWLGTGLLTAPGTKWKNMRKILTPAFHFSILEQFVPIFESNVATLVSLLKKESNKGIVDVSPFITMCTLDNICETAMGVKINAQINTESEYVITAKEMCDLALQRIKSLVGRLDLTYPLTTNYYKEKRCVNILHSFTDNVINIRREELKKDNVDIESDVLGRKKKLAFLDILLRTTVDGQLLSHETIRDEVNTFMFAGHDTTASTVTSTLYCLANHPKVQEKTVEEQKIIFRDNINRPATFRDLQEMKYLEKVIKETLRLYPSVPFISRFTDKDVQYEEGKIIPAGLEIIIFIQGLNRNPQVFTNPDNFHPERFDNVSGMLPYSNIPFSAGPRNCIGQKFAMLEVKSIVSKLLRNFHIGPPGAGYEPIFTSELVFHSLNGMNVVLKERELCKS